MFLISLFTNLQLYIYLSVPVSYFWFHSTCDLCNPIINVIEFLDLTPCTPEASFPAKSTNLLDIHSWSFQFQQVLTTLIGSLWFLNLLPSLDLVWQAWFGNLELASKIWEANPIFDEQIQWKFIIINAPIIIFYSLCSANHENLMFIIIFQCAT